ncbi:hypothetical protein J2S53_001445 [Actinopolyspora lacussalsi]|uniref:DUF4333 domain-containing protein n=1 Tax=Actinopolyspora righensis TaxID=995060 RepID=A0A1I6XGU9_9ACTN|nr:DUF4333 domain-containing protein [Actinopolyspora righensis]MDP9641500.1 hypothetical protein [Actinopolyspora lacussalsi]SFT37510.1 protein of unknown function [Actinopolyspora righensis]
MSNPYGSSPHGQPDERHHYGLSGSPGVGFEQRAASPARSFGGDLRGSPWDRPPGSGIGSGAPEGRRRRRAWPWLLGSVILLSALVVAVLGFVTPGWFHRTVLEADSVQQGVRQIARDSYGVDGIESVTCPKGEPVRAGHSFTCEMRVGGVTKNVRVVIRDEKGTYAVGRPD